MKCIVVDDDQLSRAVVEDLVKDTDGLELVASCKDAMEAFNVLKEKDIDLVFLDVEMPKMSGMDLIRSLSDIPQVILITSHTEFALEAFEYNVTDFVAKPITPPRFIKAVEKAKGYHQNTGTVQSEGADAETIFIKTDSRLVQVAIDGIKFIEALGNYVNIYTDKGRFTVLSTMKEIERKLSAPDFMRVHRSYIVRFKKIELIEDNYIVIDGKNISIGKVYKEQLQKSLNTL